MQDLLYLNHYALLKCVGRLSRAEKIENLSNSIANSNNPAILSAEKVRRCKMMLIALTHFFYLVIQG